MSRHLKRLNSPKKWNILRKTTKYIAKPMPGAHKLDESMPISMVLKQLGYAQSTREVKNILNNHQILRDGKRVKDVKASAGVLDTISLSDEHYRIVYDNKGRLQLIQIPKNEANTKLCKVVNKVPVKGGKIQCNLSDGRNVLADKSAPKTGDTLVLEVPSQKIVQKLSLEKGAMIYLMGGKHIGTFGILESIDKNSITFKSNKSSIATAKEYALVVGKEKSAVKLQ